MEWVLYFGGSSLSATVAAFWLAIGTNPRTLILKVEHSNDMRYEDYTGPVEQLHEVLRTGDVVGLEVHAKDGDVRVHGRLYGPNFCGDMLDDWSATIELCGDLPVHLFERLLAVPDLGFCIVSQMEPPELLTRHVTVTSLPWDDEVIELGAVRNESGEWVRKAGNAPVR